MKAMTKEIQFTEDAMIYIIRGQNVMLDQDLARVYGVTTSRLNEQVKRNINRFPPEFMFQLSEKEHKALMSQFATSNSGRGGRRKLPYAFTEHGAVMVATVLNSEIAVKASIAVVKAFIRLREIVVKHKDLAEKLAQLEERYDEKFAVVFDAIRQLMYPNARKKKQRLKRIGYKRAGEK